MYVQKTETVDDRGVATIWTIVSRKEVDLEANPEDMLAMIRTTEEGSMEAMNFWGTIRLILNPQTIDIVRAAELVEQVQYIADESLA